MLPHVELLYSSSASAAVARLRRDVAHSNCNLLLELTATYMHFLSIHSVFTTDAVRIIAADRSMPRHFPRPELCRGCGDPDTREKSQQRETIRMYQHAPAYPRSVRVAQLATHRSQCRTDGCQWMSVMRPIGISKVPPLTLSKISELGLPESISRRQRRFTLMRAGVRTREGFAADRHTRFPDFRSSDQPQTKVRLQA